MRSIVRSTRLFAPFIAVAVALACDAPTNPGPDPSRPGLSTTGVSATATGGGRYNINNVFDVQFAFSAVQGTDGSVAGQFHHTTDTGDGLFDVYGAVTCLAFDATHKRAWIGGVITENNSTDPFFQQEVYQPGHDAWFRVVDYGEGANASQPDRSTFIGFENTPGIPTSAFYCATMPWPEGDARTWPLTEGNVQVRVDE